MILVLGAFCVEEETLAALGGLGNIGMGNFIGLFIAQIGGEVIVLQGRVTQPEILFGEDQPPSNRSALATSFCRLDNPT